MKRIVTTMMFLSLLNGHSFAQDFYRLVFLNPNPQREKLAPEQIDSIQKAHMDNLDSLWKVGELGPWKEESYFLPN